MKYLVMGGKYLARFYRDHFLDVYFTRKGRGSDRPRELTKVMGEVADGYFVDYDDPNLCPPQDEPVPAEERPFSPDYYVCGE